MKVYDIYTDIVKATTRALSDLAYYEYMDADDANKAITTIRQQTENAPFKGDIISEIAFAFPEAFFSKTDACGAIDFYYDKEASDYYTNAKFYERMFGKLMTILHANSVQRGAMDGAAAYYITDDDTTIRVHIRSIYPRP